MTDLGCLGLIQSRFWLFRHDSRLISTYFGHFSRRPIRPDSVDTAWFWSNLPGFEWIKAKLAWIEPSWRESVKKKKSLDMAPTRGQSCPTSGSNAAPSQPRPCFIGCNTAANEAVKYQYAVKFSRSFCPNKWSLPIEIEDACRADCQLIC